MQTEIKAGAKIDTINKKEMREVLDTVTRGWFNEVSRGDRYRRFSAKGTIAAGALLIDGTSAEDANLGPADGFIWAVQRIAVYGLTTYTGDPLTLTTEPVALYLCDNGPSSLVHPAIEGYKSFGAYELVMYPGDTLLLSGAGLDAEGIVTMTGQARELPMPLAWRLGG